MNFGRCLAKGGREGLLLFGLLLMISVQVFANDSSASLDIGGLQMTFNPDIRMASEDLYLSATEVRVDYLFENNTDHDVSTLVAFPLPPMVIGEEGNYPFIGNDPIDVIDFRVDVGGPEGTVSIHPSVEVKANRFGVDVTEVLQRHDIPLTMIATDNTAYQALQARLDAMPPVERQELERYGVIDWNTNSDGNGKPFASPHWETRVTYYWFQTFPAGETIRVSHRYHPVPRHFIFSEWDLKQNEMRQAYCYDQAFVNGVKRRIDASESRALRGIELKYVLRTGGNWMGPIGEFHLMVEKSSPEAMVSLCMDGIKKTSATTFEIWKQQYNPSEDIKLLFVASPPADE